MSRRNMSFKPGKGEVMVVGTKEEICKLALSQASYVSSDKDVNGAIACVALSDFAGRDLRNEHVIQGIDHKGDTVDLKTGFYSPNFTLGSNPEVWEPNFNP